jgi:hypothetical protein
VNRSKSHPSKRIEPVSFQVEQADPPHGKLLILLFTDYLAIYTCLVVNQAETCRMKSNRRFRTSCGSLSQN